MKYSVIIPHKNVPKLLARCVNSIPVRDDIEVIVIDDCSSPEFNIAIEEICNRKNTVLLRNNKSLGGGGARNKGLEVARGKWIIFADSDDFFVESFWDKVDDCIIGNYEIFYFKVQGVNSETLEPTKRGSNYSQLVDNLLENRKHAEDIIRIYHFVPWGKVISHDLVERENIRFDEVMTSNDVMFNTISGTKAKGIKACNELMYVVTIREGSLTKNKTLESLKCRYLVDLRRSRYLMSIGKPQYAGIPYALVKRTCVLYGYSILGWHISQLFITRTNLLKVAVYKILTPSLYKSKQ